MSELRLLLWRLNAIVQEPDAPRVARIDNLSQLFFFGLLVPLNDLNSNPARARGRGGEARPARRLPPLLIQAPIHSMETIYLDHQLRNWQHPFLENKNFDKQPEGYFSHFSLFFLSFPCHLNRTGSSIPSNVSTELSTSDIQASKTVACF